MSVSITPFLMFEGNAEDAINLYVSAIPDAEIISLQRYGKDETGKEGSIHIARISLAKQEIMCIDSHINHAFSFTPSMSLFIELSDPDKFETVINKLSLGGGFLMPVDNYGFSKQFAWLNDRFGVSWQINLT